MAKESSPVPATPLEDRICSRTTPWPLYVQRDMSRVPLCQRYQTTRALTQDRGELNINNKIKQIHVGSRASGLYVACVMNGRWVCDHACGGPPLRNLLRAGSKFCDALPLNFYDEHDLICRSADSTGEFVCASSGCSRLVIRCGADCVGRCCFMCQAHFYRRLVLDTSHIKLTVQPCLKKVRKGAGAIISLLYPTRN